MHALGFVEKGKHGKSVLAYAKEAGREKEVRSVQREIEAAEVASEIGHLANLSESFRALTEIHAAPRWLWPDLLVNGGKKAARKKAEGGGRPKKITGESPVISKEPTAVEVIAEARGSREEINRRVADCS